MTVQAKNMINLVRYSFIMLWGYAATVKLWYWEQSRSEMFLQPLPAEISSLLFWLIPLFELVLVVILLNRQTIALGILLSVILTSCFTLYLFLALNKAFGDIPCACGGILSTISYQSHIMLNIFFMGFGILTMILIHKGKTGDVLQSASRKEGSILS